jgi:threonine/homoserine/homoserine lactone efflux protein
MTSAYLIFLGAATMLAITPGPGIAYVVARTVSGGRGEGLASCLGTALGGLIHVLAAALGLSVLIAKSATAYSVVKYVGAAYLIYLGIRTLRSTRAHIAQVTVRPVGVRRALLEGVLVEAMNVKTAMFFLAFIPQFVRVDAPATTQFLILGSICVVLNTVADVIAVLGAHRILASGESTAGRGRVMSQISACTMIGLGAYVALSRQSR